MKKILVFIINVILLTSCVQNELDNSDPAITKNSNNELNIIPISNFTTKDSLNAVSIFQSDVDIFMLRHIQIDKGVFVLSITFDDAEKMGVSQDEYQHYVSLISSYNE